MPTDWYTKAILTVIAAALVVLGIQNATPNATAQQSGLTCTVTVPCYVTNTGINPLHVVESRAAATPREGLRNIPPGSGQPK